MDSSLMSSDADCVSLQKCIQAIDCNTEDQIILWI